MNTDNPSDAEFSEEEDDELTGSAGETAFRDLANIDAGESDPPHSPVDSNMLLLKISQDVQGIRTEVRELSSKIDHALSEIAVCKNEVKELRKTTSSLSTELQMSKNEIVLLKSKNEVLQNRMMQLDNYTRRSNLIFYGVRQVPDENCSQVIKALLSKQLGIETAYDMKLERCHRLSARSDPKPIIVRFNWYQDRIAVWKCRAKLKGSNISMREDFPAEIIECRKTLYPVMKKAKELKKEAFLVADKLTIDGMVYTTSNLHTLPPTLDPAALATKKIGNVTAFCSKSSPLSNFYEANIRIDNNVFSTVEQYVQYQKAVFAEKTDVAIKIRNTKSPALCKKFGDGIEIDESSWLPLAKKSLERACMVKFQQNACAKMYLVNTGDTILAEATRDKYWGIGLPLSSTSLGDRSKWTGANTFGTILMSVRDRLK
jgi:ribA/ribD-fused uncharacterized protein